MRGLARYLVWLVPAALLSCAALIETRQAEEKAKEPPRPSVNHAAHLARDLVCIDCHDPDETGTPVMPAAETCFDCHEDLEKENDRVKAYFKTAKQKDGSYKFERPKYSDDLIMSHENHGKNEVSCESCHGKPGNAAFARPDPVRFMKTCMACHAERSAANECATCHKETRKDKKPASHAQSGFQRLHGKSAPTNWKKGQGESCALCHEVPNNCNECHHSTKPDSHKAAGFLHGHGTGDTDASLDLFENVSCALCHEENGCTRCHQVMEPRNHSIPFKRRLHGIMADIERQTCMTCHKQDTCMRCHQTTRPVTHRGNWRQVHCLGCHEPLPTNGCFVCHKNTLGHLTAPALPPGPPHATATSAQCRACHTVLPHFDDGGDCRRCHR